MQELPQRAWSIMGGEYKGSEDPKIVELFGDVTPGCETPGYGKGPGRPCGGQGEGGGDGEGSGDL